MPDYARLHSQLPPNPIAHFIARDSGRVGFDYASNSIHALTGYEPGQFTSDPAFWSDHIHPQDRPRVLEMLDRLNDTDTLTFDYRFRHADGGWRRARNALDLVRKNNESPEIIGSWIDITVEEVGEAETQGARQDFHTIVEALEQGVLVYRNFTPLYTNAAFARLLGYGTSEEVVALGSMNRIYAPHEHDRLRDYAPERLQVGEIPATYKFDAVRKDGTDACLQIVARVIEWEGEPAVLLTCDTRIEPEKTIAALIQNEIQLHLILDNLPCLITYVDNCLRYRYVNKTSESWHMRAKSELIGMSVRDVLGELSFRKLFPRMQKALQGVPQRFEESVMLPDGRTRDLEIVYVPDNDSHGEVLGYYVLILDITERKLAEKKLYQYQDQLRALASEVNLVEQRERQRIATELHDRTIQMLGLTRIKLGALRASLSSPDPVPLINETIALVDGAIQDTRALLFELSPPVLYELGFIAALEWLAEQSERRYGFACELRDSRISKTLSRDLQVTLFQFVRELLANASKHGRANEVQVDVNGEHERIRICVEDDGVGFLEGRDQVTYSLSTGGFGLFNIRERLAVLDGEIEIESLSGEGSRITLTVPLDR